MRRNQENPGKQHLARQGLIDLGPAMPGINPDAKASPPRPAFNLEPLVQNVQ